jgi:hypothetical protein
MGRRTAPKAYACTPPSSSGTPTAFALNASVALCSFLSGRVRSVSMPNSPKGEAVSKVPKDPNWEKGGLMRALLDRDGPLYHIIYNRRTSCERINSQAKALGIEYPKVRNIHSVRNLNTLIYLIMNVRALQKAKSINTGLLHMN